MDQVNDRLAHARAEGQQILIVHVHDALVLAGRRLGNARLLEQAVYTTDAYASVAGRLVLERRPEMLLLGATPASAVSGL